MNIFKTISNLLTTPKTDITADPLYDMRTQKEKEAFYKEFKKRDKHHGLLPR